MKKLLFVAALAVFGFSVNAQEDGTGGFSEGDLYVSGTLGFNSFSQGDADSSAFNFSPSVGYFISDNIALEFGLIIGSEEDELEDKFSNFGAALGGTYFFTPSNQFSFTLGAGLTYISSKFEPNGGGDVTTNIFGIAVSPGVNYFISDAFALRASVGALSYTSAKADFDGADAANNFGLNLNLSNINFGLTYKF